MFKQTQQCKDDNSTQIDYEFKANLIKIPVGYIMKLSKVIDQMKDAVGILRGCLSLLSPRESVAKCSAR